MDITDIKRIIIVYHKQLHDNKFDNLIEEDKVWKKQITKTDTRINWKISIALYMYTF